jgi:ribosome-associated heat shock protein Hsp15
MRGMESVRVDKWLWAIRRYKTRSDATEACRGGHVKINGEPAKPASVVKVGYLVETTGGGHERRFEVAQLIEKRVSAPLAATCFIDHSPPPPPTEAYLRPLFRDPGTGRPTKRERRQLDRLRQP